MQVIVRRIDLGSVECAKTPPDRAVRRPRDSARSRCARSRKRAASFLPGPIQSSTLRSAAGLVFCYGLRLAPAVTLLLVT